VNNDDAGEVHNSGKKMQLGSKEGSPMNAMRQVNKKNSDNQLFVKRNLSQNL
jgi:hypothetical protein